MIALLATLVLVTNIILVATLLGYIKEFYREWNFEHTVLTTSLVIAVIASSFLVYVMLTVDTT